jgi:hypothetical protein
MQRRHHYELAFEAYLRSRRIPYVAVDEARKALLPEGASLRVIDPAEAALAATGGGAGGAPPGRTLKSFDAVLYGTSAGDRRGSVSSAAPENVLAEVKGRRIATRRRKSSIESAGRAGSGAEATPGRGGALFDVDAPGRGRPTPRLECWVTEDDIWSLKVWQALFGSGFSACFVFVYWCEEQPPGALFEEMFDFRGRWYAIRAVRVDAYAAVMRPRSTRWRTVHLAQAEFDRISGPLVAAGA